MEIKGYHYTYRKNLKSILKKGLIPHKPNTNGISDPQAVYCFTNLEELENGLNNWLSDKMHFDEETTDLEGAILEVDLTGIPTIEGAPWEHVIPSKINPERIKIIEG